MGHPNPRFLAVARRAAPPEAPLRERRKEIGMGWKIAALVACGGVLFWTLSSPSEPSEGGPDADDERGGPPRALPPGQGVASVPASASASAQDAGASAAIADQAPKAEGG